jgi:hypothetical protein
MVACIEICSCADSHGTTTYPISDAGTYTRHTLPGWTAVCMCIMLLGRHRWQHRLLTNPAARPCPMSTPCQSPGEPVSIGHAATYHDVSGVAAVCKSTGCSKQQTAKIPRSRRCKSTWRAGSAENTLFRTPFVSGGRTPCTRNLVSPPKSFTWSCSQPQCLNRLFCQVGSDTSATSICEVKVLAQRRVKQGISPGCFPGSPLGDDRGSHAGLQAQVLSRRPAAASGTGYQTGCDVMPIHAPATIKSAC